MEVSPERVDMLIEDVHELRQQQGEAAKFYGDVKAFNGKIEGGVRVLHVLLQICAGGMIALCAAAVHSFGSLNAVKDKVDNISSHFDPVKLEIMQNDVADLKQRVNGLEHPSVIDPHKPRH